MSAAHLEARAKGGARARGLACALVALSLALPPARGAASEHDLSHKEQVLSLFRIARQLLDDGKIDEACAVLEQGRRLDPTAINLLLRLGECLARAGRTASAWNMFGEAAAVAKSAGDARAARAAALSAALEPRLSRLAIAVPAASAAAGLEIRRDGVLLSPSQWGQAIPVDPGPHTIEARAPGRRRWSVVRSLGEDGARAVVEVPALQEEVPALQEDEAPRQAAASPRRLATAPLRATASPQEDAREEGGRAGRALALTSAGAALVGMSVGAVFGATALAKRNASNRGHCDAESRCDAVGVALRAEAQEAGTASTIAFTIGAGAALASALLWWMEPSGAGERRAGRGASAFAVIGPGHGALILQGSY